MGNKTRRIKKTLIKCDKCGSTNVEETLIDPPRPEPQTMTEWMNRPKFPRATLEIKYYKYALTCLDCGYRVEYWQ